MQATENVAEARSHFTKGLALYNDGRYEDARLEFERANALAPNHRILYNLALASDGQGDRAGAIGYLTDYLAQGGADIEPERRKEAESLLSRLRARVALVTIKTNVTGDAGVVVDEQPYGEVSAKPLVLLPGARKIWVTKAGYYPAIQTVLLKEGEGTDLVFELKELPRAIPTRPAVASPWWRDRRTLGGVAAFGLVAAASLLMSRKKRAANSVVQLNPYQDERSEERNVVQPQTPEHATVIRVDTEAASTANQPPLALDAAAATDIGRVKPSNEDSHLLDAEKGIFVVADGIGGFAGGGVASKIAVETIATYFRKKPAVGTLTHLPEPAAELANAVFSANAAIRRRQTAEINIADMGSTCVAARFSGDNHDLHVVHVGDSRVYRLRAGKLQQVTNDHTMAELGITGKRAQHLSRALGSEACPKVDVLVLRTQPDDLYLLCCDGLNKMVSDEDLKRILEAAPSPTDAVNHLVSDANAKGGLDNITALVVRVTLRS